MSRARRMVVALGACAILVMFLVPPFFGVDRASEGRLHAAMGRRPVWSAPTSEQVFRALAPPGTPVPAARRLADFEPRVNRVRLTAEAFAVALAMVIVGALLDRRRTA